MKNNTFTYWGERTETSNKYFSYNPLIDEDTVLIRTSNLKRVKGSWVLVVDDNKAVYLKDWQVRLIKSKEYGITSPLVRLSRNYFKAYTFQSNFENMGFEKEDTFDSLYELAKVQGAVEDTYKEEY